MIDEGALNSAVKRIFSLVFKPIWFSTNATSFEQRSKSIIDIDVVDAAGLYPAIDHARFKGLDLKAYRFRHFDDMVRVVTFDEPIVREISQSGRISKVEVK